MKRRFLFVFVLILCLASSAAMADLLLPAGIKTIEPEAFMNDVSINEVVLPDGVETIGSKAFYGCEGLEAVTIGSGVTEIGKNAFYGCTGLADVYYGGTQSEWDDISIASGNDALLGAELHVCLAAPTGVGIEAANTDYYYIWWDQMPDATGYRIYSSENSSVSKNSDYTEYSPDNTYTFFVLYPGQQRYFAMSALYGNEESQLTAVMTDTPLEPMPAPQNARVESVDADGVAHLAWDAVTGATNYRIFYSSSPEYDQNNWHIYTESDQPSFDLNLDQYGLNTDTVYFWITVQTDLGPGYPSEMVSVSFIPVIGGFAWLTDCYVISWDEVPGVTGYRVYYGTDSYVTKECPYYEQGADETVCYINTTPGVQYYFAVSALFADSESGLSAVITDTPVQPLPAPEDPMIVSADADGWVYLQWSAVESADNYRVYCSDDPVFNPADECYVLNENATELSIDLAGYFDVPTDGTCYLWIAADTTEGPGRPSERLTLNWMEYTVYQLAAPVLQQVCQDGMGGVTLSWNAFGSDYLYQVYGGRSGTTPRLIATTRDASCTVQTVSNGQYTYYVCAGREDSSGYAVYGAMSDPLSVSVQRIWQAPITLYGVTQTDGQSCVMTWSELSPKDRYEGERLWPDGSIETQFVCRDLSFDFDLPDDETYTYRVRAYYTKNGIDYYSPWSNTVTHQRIPQNQIAPAAPELTRHPSADGVLLYGDVELAWIPNDNARSVYVTVEKKNGSDYLPVADYNIEKGTAFAIPSAVFDFIPANGQAQIRVSVGSEGAVRGEPVILTFSMYGKGTVLIDGQAAAAVWNRPYRTAAGKTYTITAGESWTAASTATWLQVVRDGNLLTVSITDNPAGESRTGTVTVSCEGGSQTITVAQGTVLYAPAFYLSDGTESGDYLGIPLSQDQNSPTPVSYKSFKVNIDRNNADYIQIKWYFANYPGGAVTDSGTWTSKTYGHTADNIGAVYCLEASARMANNAAVAADDSPVAKYYYILKNVEDFLLLDGQENTTVYARTDTVAKLAASDDVTWQTDVNWMTVTEEYRNTPKARRLVMTCTENTTGSNRTGHVTVTCGSKSGVITVIQIPNVPQITSPSLSTNSSSPTTISKVYSQLTISGATEFMIDEYLSSGWSSVLIQTVHEAEDCPYVMGINLYDEIGSTSATKFRFGVSDDYGHTTYYYFKYTSSTKHIYLGTKSKPNTDTFMLLDAAAAQTNQSFYMASSDSWTTSYSADWLTVSPSSGSSTTSQSVTVTAQRNTTGAARTATIQFKISGTVYAECRVTQSAEDQVVVTYDGLPLSQTNALSYISPSSEVSVPLKAYGTSTVTADTDVSWITIDSSNRIYIADNTGAARSGHVTYTCGSASQTVTLTQLARLGAVTLKSHTLSTDSSAPTFLPYSDTGLTLSWNRVSGAVKYEIFLKKNDSGSYTRLYVNDTGSSTCTYTIPASYFDPAYTGKYDFRIFAVDERGNVGLSSGLFFFTCSVSGGALLDGKNAQTWNSVNDLGDSKSYVIASTAGWTASVNASWIHFNPASGSSGEVLTVTLDQNPGAQRTGKVTVTSGGGSAVLNITQCAALAAYPEITSPALSLYKSSPAMFAKTDSLTVTWQTEPQVGFYEIDLCEASGHVVQHASGIKTGTYTFDTGALIPGRIYMIEIQRNLNVSRSGNYAADYYFCYTPDSAELIITSSHSSVMDDLTFIGDGSEENAYYDVSSSGTWIATVSDPDWIMLSRRAWITAEYLAEAGENSSDYRQLIGEDGTSFRLCLLANETGASRSGTVTVTTPGASVTFEVTQSASYMLPAITSPYISSRPGTAESLPYGDIALTWNKGSGTTGVVTLTLFENGNAGYVQVWKAAGLTGTSATVPGSVMQERTDYRLRVETKINDLGETDYRNYYFRTGAANELSLNATVDWTQALYGGAVTVRASAYGGAGNYRYDYQLLHNGQIESESGFTTDTYYSFIPSGTGNYRLKVIAADQDDSQAEYVSDWEKTDTNVISVAVASQYVANLTAQPQTLNYTVISNGTWTVTNYPYWTELTVETGASGSDIGVSIGANSGNTRTGRITFESSTGITSVLTITQVGSESSQPGSVDQDLPPVDYETVQVVLQSTQIMVGENLVADVTAYGATAVRLVVDNIPYEEYLLDDGFVHVERMITSAGAKQIQFQAYVDGMWGWFSEPVILQVNPASGAWIDPAVVSSWNIGANGGDATLRIKTNGRWSIISVPEWIVLNTAYGFGQAELSISVNENSGSARDARMLINEEPNTYSLYISQEGTGAGLAEPVFLYPAQDNATLDFADVTFEWTAEGAASSILSLRDLTTNQLIIFHENVGTETTFTLPSSAFISGHQYRVAVGVSEEQTPVSSEVTKWKELVFSIANDTQHSASISGTVVSANGNPLTDVLVTVRSDGWIIATAETDPNGFWHIEKLYHDGEYALVFSKPGYVFSEDTTVTVAGASISVDTIVSDSAYDDEVIVLSANTDSLSFGSERYSADLYIVSNASWTIGSDAPWLSFSPEQGTGNGWVTVTAASNTNAEAGSEDRIAVITIEEIPIATRAARLMANGLSARTATVSASQGSPTAEQTSALPFEENTYTGAPVEGSYDFFGNLTIDKNMDLNSGVLNVDGNVTIKATVNFGSNGKLNVSGKLIVCGNGMLNMKYGGIVTVEGDFVFDSSKSHKYFLEKGEIKVGGNVEIKQNFFAGSGHLFTVMDNGNKHIINMHDKWFNDQNFGTFNAEASISKLDIKRGFDALDSIWNYRCLEQYHSGYPYELNRIEIGFGSSSSLEIPDEINSRIQSGIIQMIGKYGHKEWFVDAIKCNAVESFSYVDSNGEIKQYQLDLDMGSYFRGGMGTVTYDSDGNKYTCAITHPYDDIGKMLKAFQNWKKDLIKNAVADEIRGLAIDAFASSILRNIPFGSTSTREITTEMAKYAKDLNDFLKILNE